MKNKSITINVGKTIVDIKLSGKGLILSSSGNDMHPEINLKFSKDNLFDIISLYLEGNGFKLEPLKNVCNSKKCNCKK